MSLTFPTMIPGLFDTPADPHVFEEIENVTFPDDICQMTLWLGNHMPQSYSVVVPVIHRPGGRITVLCDHSLFVFPVDREWIDCVWGRCDTVPLQRLTALREPGRCYADKPIKIEWID